MVQHTQNYPQDIKITKVEQVTVEVDRPPSTVNSRAKEMVYPEPNWKWNESLIRIYTSEGTLGWGVGRAESEVGQKALNQNPFDLLNPTTGVSEAFRSIETALWDLEGKILGKPVYQLIGLPIEASSNPDSTTDRLPAYDSTLYFDDLVCDTKEAGLKRIGDEVENALNNGFRACKMKIGRGCYLMEHDEGLQRDIEVVKLARQIAGDDFNILVDANNGYTYDETVEFLNETSGVGIFWIEEMFEEEVEKYRALKGVIQNSGLKTLIVDGETRTRQPIEFFEPFFAAGVLDAIQHDMKGLGITGWRRLANMTQQYDGVKCAPHNWGSLFGFFLSLQFGKTIPNFLYGEVATLTSDVVDTSGYIFKDGAFSVPDTPGLGLELNQQVYNEKYAGREDWKVE
jgi:L-alanine-DL-glutamate epimerase-like enolase superfamily enzyme